MDKDRKYVRVWSKYVNAFYGYDEMIVRPNFLVIKKDGKALLTLSGEYGISRILDSGGTQDYGGWGSDY